MDRNFEVGVVVAVLGLICYALSILVLYQEVSASAAAAVGALGGIVLLAVGVKTMVSNDGGEHA